MSEGGEALINIFEGGCQDTTGKEGRLSFRNADNLSQAEEGDSDLHSIQEVSEEPSGEDLNYDEERDYNRIAILDQYEAEGIDDEGHH